MMTSFGQYFELIATAISAINQEDLENAHRRVSDVGNILIMGNGGSAAIADHFVCDVMKGINTTSPFKFAAQSLCSNVPLITAIANDIGYDHIFAKQIEYACLDHTNYFTSNNLVIAVSSSGNSLNIINGLEAAKKRNIPTLALTGFKGGKAAEIADHKVVVPIENYGVVEDVHMMILHAIAQQIRSKHCVGDLRL